MYYVGQQRIMGIGRKATDQRTPVENFWLRHCSEPVLISGCSSSVYRMCAQVASSGEYLRGHGRVAVDVTALRRLWQHSPVLGLVVPACVPVCAVLRGSLLCNCCGLSAVEINEELLIIISVNRSLRSPSGSV